MVDLHAHTSADGLRNSRPGGLFCSPVLASPLLFFRVFLSVIEYLFPPTHTHTHSWILLLSPRLSSSCSSERQEDIDQEEIALPDNETLKEIGGERIQETELDQREKRFRGREGFPLTCFANSLWLCFFPLRL